MRALEALEIHTKTQPGPRALLPATRHRSSGPLGALLSSSALPAWMYVRLPPALQLLQVLRPQDAQAQTVEKGIDSIDSQKSALGPRANAMTASSVSSLASELISLLYAAS